MEKNCSGCKGFHAAPFGSRCKYKDTPECSTCHGRHPLGPTCARLSEYLSTVTMARNDPVSELYTDRSDPKYLLFLEDSFMKQSERKDSEMELIRRRLGVAVGGDGALGGLHNDPREDDDAPDDVVGPLTDVLQKLSIAVDPTNTSHKLKGMDYKPEYHVQHVKQGLQLKQIDHSKLTYREFVYGWFCVIQHLTKARGDVAAYVRHCKYVSSLAMLSQFTGSAYVGYNRHVVTQVIEGDVDTFVAGDTLGVASHFHAGNIILKKVAPKVGKQGGSFRWNKRQSTDNQSDKVATSMPDGFPEDVCYSYNYKSCTGKCSKQHVCRNCGGNHRAIGCNEKDKKSSN